MSTYFGNNTDGIDDAYLSGYTNFQNPTYIPYVCPGSGLQNVDELGIRAYSINPGNVRCAIYDTSKNFLMQGSVEIAVVSPSATWYTHTAFVDQAGTPITTPQLTGGVTYLLVSTADGSELSAQRDIVTAGYCKYLSNDYTGGYPTSLAAGTDSSSKICIRCGVTEAAGGLSISATETLALTEQSPIFLPGGLRVVATETLGFTETLD